MLADDFAIVQTLISNEILKLEKRISCLETLAIQNKKTCSSESCKDTWTGLPDDLDED